MWSPHADLTHTWKPHVSSGSLKRSWPLCCAAPDPGPAPDLGPVSCRHNPAPWSHGWRRGFWGLEPGPGRSENHAQRPGPGNTCFLPGRNWRREQGRPRPVSPPTVPPGALCKLPRDRCSPVHLSSCPPSLALASLSHSGGEMNNQEATSLPDPLPLTSSCCPCPCLPWSLSPCSSCRVPALPLSQTGKQVPREVLRPKSRTSFPEGHRALSEGQPSPARPGLGS